MAIETKNERWCFTAWHKPEPKLKFFNYIVWGFESTKLNEIPHYQGYCELSKEYNMKWVKRLLGCTKVHLSPARACREVNVLYCLKNGNGSFVYNKTPEINFNSGADWTEHFND